MLVVSMQKRVSSVADYKGKPCPECGNEIRARVNKLCIYAGRADSHPKMAKIKRDFINRKAKIFKAEGKCRCGKVLPDGWKAVNCPKCTGLRDRHTENMMGGVFQNLETYPPVA